MLASIVRTVVPIIVGALLGWPIVTRLGITSEQATTAVTVVVTAAYYVLVRVFETYISPRFGILLGLARRPDYTAPTSVR